MKKLKNLFKKIKNKEFKYLFIRSLGFKIINLSLDYKLPIPQSYSFFTIGTHGVGFQSLLYFLSFCSYLPHNANYSTPPH